MRSTSFWVQHMTPPPPPSSRRLQTSRAAFLYARVLLIWIFSFCLGLCPFRSLLVFARGKLVCVLISYWDGGIDRGLLAGRLRKVNILRVFERERVRVSIRTVIWVNPLLARTDELNSGCEIINKINHLPGVCRVLGPSPVLMRQSPLSIKRECSCQSWELKHFVN